MIFCKLDKKIFLFLKSYMTPIYLLIIVFPKFDPLTATGMALCVNHGPNRYIFIDYNYKDSSLNMSFPFLKYIFRIWERGLASSILDHVFQIFSSLINFQILFSRTSYVCPTGIFIFDTYQA
jgi:hypothetical protein